MNKLEIQAGDYVAVCPSCLRHSCWAYIKLCANWYHQHPTYKTRAELKKLNLESPKFWEPEF